MLAWSIVVAWAILAIFLWTKMGIHRLAALTNAKPEHKNDVWWDSLAFSKPHYFNETGNQHRKCYLTYMAAFGTVMMLGFIVVIFLTTP